MIVGGWYVSGHLGYVAEDPRTLEEAFVATNSGRPESYSFVAPAAYLLELLMLWSDQSKLVTFGIAGVLGMAAGSAAMALATRTFRWEGFASTEDLVNHIAGGVLMGFGGVTALGCTIGQGLTGISTLAVGSFMALAAIVAGCVAALEIPVLAAGQHRRHERSTMIVYDLVCAQQHRFEGWFASTEDYARQHDQTMIRCPVCDDAAIERRPSANVQVGRAALPGGRARNRR